MPVRYVSSGEDRARWLAVPLRDGDIVVSTRSKHGTTWVQAILLMLVHGVPLPAPLAELSPWVDHVVEPIEEVVRRLDGQRHRRVLKSHTPLDGLPDDPAIHRVVVARHPLDAAVSLHHQAANLDRDRMAELTGAGVDGRGARPDLATWLGRWVRQEADPVADLDSLDGVLHHLTDAWRRRHDPGVILVHYADLVADLDGEVRRVARAVGLPHEPAVARSATFDAMQARADELVPDRHALLHDRAAFFRRGRSGEGVAAIPPHDLAHYRRRIRGALEDDLARWLHR